MTRSWSTSARAVRRLSTLAGLLAAIAIAAHAGSAAAAAVCGNNSLDGGEDCDFVGGVPSFKSPLTACPAYHTLACRPAIYPIVADRCTRFCKPTFTCGDGNLEPGEACDGTDFGGKACADYLCSGVTCNSGSLTCSACAIDSSTCSYTPTATCRTHTSVSTDFDRGALIIPMDGDSGEPDYQPDVVKTTGLIWHLLKHGIRVATVLDTGKAVINAADFTIGSGAGIHHLKLDRSDPTDYSKWTAVSRSAGMPYSGGPFVIPAADANAALRLIYEGTLPEDPSVGFGWALSGVSTFDDVVIHLAREDFSAPVYRMRSKPPQRLAIFGDDASNWMIGFIGFMGLDFSGAGGTPASPGLVYDVVTATDITDDELSKQDYKVLWLGDYSYDSSHAAAFTKIAAFNAGGGAIAAMDQAVEALEVEHPAQCGCSETQFMSWSGVTAGGGVGSFTTPLETGNPYLQTGGLAIKGMGGTFTNWLPTGPPTIYRDCGKALLETSGSDHLIALLDDASKGPVIYVGGHNYPGFASQMIAIRRAVTNTLFSGSAAGWDNNPVVREVSRSTPVVVDNTQTTTPQVMMFHGTFETPQPTNNLFFNPSSPASWIFPGSNGHLRAIDMSAVSTTADPTAFDSFGASVYWDAATRIPVAASRSIYTATGTVPQVRASFTTGVSTTVKNALNVGSTANADLMIGRIRGAGLGGVDSSTAAYIQTGNQVTFASAYIRPVVVYVGGLDGMLHAFRVKNIEEAGTPYTLTDWSGDTTLVELWAYIPYNQLGLLKTNSAGILASPTVADLLGDFVLANGNPGQDGIEEWRTLLTLATGDTGRRIYAVDVTDPDPSNTNCPNGFSTCVHGPNPLWTVSPTGMGNARGTAIGLMNTAGGVKPAVFVATNDGSATGNSGGLRVFALDATTGATNWSTAIAYTRTIPGRISEPNEMPAPAAAVDKFGGSGYPTHLYVADLQGKLWEIDAETGTATARWDAGGTDTVANYPITAPLSLYRDLSGKLHVVAATGGTHWAPSDATTQQKLVDIEVSSTTAVATTLMTFAAGERVFAAPVVSNQDVYVITSEGLTDFLSSAATDAGGTAYRINISDLSAPSTASFSVGASASGIGVSEGGKMVISTTEKAAVRDNSGATTTSTKPMSSTAGSVVAKLRLWLGDLK